MTRDASGEEKKGSGTPDLRKERQLAGIQVVRKRNGGKCPWGGSWAGRRIKVTLEKEELIRKLRAEGQMVGTIARLTKGRDQSGPVHALHRGRGAPAARAADGRGPPGEFSKEHPR